MFSLTICLGAASWRLIYKTEDKAAQHYATARAPDRTVDFNPNEHFELEDDFGQRACFRRSAIVAVMLENLMQSRAGSIEFGMHNAYTQRDLQKRMQADPSFRSPMSGPAMLNPMGNGPFPQ